MTTIAFLGLVTWGGPMAANPGESRAHGARFDPVPAAVEPRKPTASRCFRPPSSRGGCRGGDHNAPSGSIVKTLYAEIPAGRHFRCPVHRLVDHLRRRCPPHQRQANDRGFAQVDAPVSGGVKGAVAGTLAFMVGGTESAFAAARSTLDPMAGKIIHCGSAGAGRRPKCATTWCWRAADRRRRGVQAG